MRVKCTSAGCPWVNELGSLEKHLETCGFALVPCANGCKEQIMRSEHTSHCTEVCPLRQYTCEHCKSEGTYKEMTSGHLDECPDFKVPCTNSGCGVTIKRKQMALHHLRCPYKTIDCPYKDVGCTYTSPRHAMEDHKATFCGHHLDLAMVEVAKLGKYHTQQECRPFVTKMPNFNQVKMSRYSPGFYTHPSGYKMCLRVDANGSGDGKGTHVSVFMHLMKGENDDTLTWPIRYKCTITLLNQLKDEGHYCKTINCATDEADEVNSRMLSGERGEGWGYSKFIPRDQLDLQEDKQCQYLKDDSLYFRVQVEVLPACKPWLMVTLPSEDA